MKMTKGMLVNTLEQQYDRYNRLSAAHAELRQAWEEEAKARIDAEHEAKELRRLRIEDGQKWQAARSRLEGTIRHLIGVIGDPESMVRIDAALNRAPEGYKTIVLKGAMSPQAASQLKTPAPLDLANASRRPLKDFP